jgi:hypothetical protein
MSGYVAGLCWKVNFGCATAKAVAVALADHANDEGTRAYPSIKRLSDKVELHPRTVQRALRKLEAMGVISLVANGGRGPRSTREWAFNLELIQAVMNGTAEFNKGGAMPSLEDVAKGGAEYLKGGAEYLKGDTSATQTFTKRQETSSAPLPPSDGASAASGQAVSINREVKGGERPSSGVRPSIRIRPGDVGWAQWLETIESRLGEREREAAVMAGEIRVSMRWPTDETPMPAIARVPS